MNTWAVLVFLDKVLIGKIFQFRYEKDRGRGKERDVYRETGIKKHVMIDGNRKTDRDEQKKRQRM